MSEVKPTPGPWHVGDIPDRNPIIYDAKGWPIADAKTFHGRHAAGTGEANAEFIVRACNAHDDLVTAAKEAAVVIAEMAKAAGGNPMKGTCLPRLLAAVAKATGGAS